VAYQTLQTIVDFMEKDIPVLAASKSFYYLKEGKKQIDTGGFVGLFENMTSKSVKVMGKPSEDYFTAGVHKLGGKVEEIIIIGDDYKTDILGANKVAIKAILIISGKFHAEDEVLSNHDLCVNNFKEIIEAIEKGVFYV
jgi:ribonucleotide monophosphatase NagD (HAD superfamily)